MFPPRVATGLLVLLTSLGAGGCTPWGLGPSARHVTTPATSRPATEACSAAGLDLKLPDEPKLPPAVARTRHELFDAASACDFDSLGTIAGRNTAGFGFTSGTETDPAAYWRSVDAKQRTLERLARILTGPYVVTNQGSRAFAWPNTYTDAPTASDYAALVRSGAYTQAEADAFRKDGSYYGYRVSIAPDGTWQFFTVGD
ncbi:MAG: hypothetical protein JWM98_2143 [Thermoleophilia bacterium]|nr:hypothetical protein [Thermoleophilia bacterium]